MPLLATSLPWTARNSGAVPHHPGSCESSVTRVGLSAGDRSDTGKDQGQRWPWCTSGPPLALSEGCQLNPGRRIDFSPFDVETSRGILLAGGLLPCRGRGWHCRPAQWPVSIPSGPPLEWPAYRSWHIQPGVKAGPPRCRWQFLTAGYIQGLRDLALCFT